MEQEATQGVTGTQRRRFLPPQQFSVADSSGPCGHLGLGCWNLCSTPSDPTWSFGSYVVTQGPSCWQLSPCGHLRSWLEALPSSTRGFQLVLRIAFWAGRKGKLWVQAEEDTGEGL